MSVSNVSASTSSSFTSTSSVAISVLSPTIFFVTVEAVENIPQVDFYEAAELTQENMDLSEFKFLSPVMNLIIEGEPSEENIVEVTFTVNNLTDKIEPFMLHRCEEHGWEILKAEKVGDNQIKVSILIYSSFSERGCGI